MYDQQKAKHARLTVTSRPTLKTSCRHCMSLKLSIMQHNYNSAISVFSTVPVQTQLVSQSTLSF